MGQLKKDPGTNFTCSIDLSEFAGRLAETIRDQEVLLKNLFITTLLAKDVRRSIRLHILNSDSNGRPQVGMLVRQLCYTIIDYCIPRKHIKEAILHFNDTGSSQRIAALKYEAQSLFTDISNSGEGGELLLFILTESVLGYPQILSKMALKTSSKMHFHGMDGVYISCTGNGGELRLHFGESKLHKDPKNSVRKATYSIASMLTDEGFLESASRDYYLLNTQADLNDSELEDALRGFLDPLDTRFLAPEVCAVLLAGHELKNYPVVLEEKKLPKAITIKANELIEVLEESAKKKKIESFHIDLFIVPFPDLQAFRDLLLKELCVK